MLTSSGGKAGSKPKHPKRSTKLQAIGDLKAPKPIPRYKQLEQLNTTKLTALIKDNQIHTQTRGILQPNRYENVTKRTVLNKFTSSKPRINALEITETQTETFYEEVTIIKKPGNNYEKLMENLEGIRRKQTKELFRRPYRFDKSTADLGHEPTFVRKGNQSVPELPKYRMQNMRDIADKINKVAKKLDMLEEESNYFEIKKVSNESNIKKRLNEHKCRTITNLNAKLNELDKIIAANENAEAQQFPERKLSLYHCKTLRELSQQSVDNLKMQKDKLKHKTSNTLSVTIELPETHSNEVTKINLIKGVQDFTSTTESEEDFHHQADCCCIDCITKTMEKPDRAAPDDDLEELFKGCDEIKHYYYEELKPQVSILKKVSFDNKINRSTPSVNAESRMKMLFAMLHRILSVICKTDDPSSNHHPLGPFQHVNFSEDVLRKIADIIKADKVLLENNFRKSSLKHGIHSGDCSCIECITKLFDSL